MMNKAIFVVTLTMMSCCLFLLLATSVQGFSVNIVPSHRTSSFSSSSALSNADKWTGGGNGGNPSGVDTGRLERIICEIFPDGSFEARVVGVKGNECLKITEGLMKAMGGEVLISEPTEEMFQQEVVTDQTLYNTDPSESWDDTSSW
jgi:Protein of unknown function (DUF2997)